MSERPPAPDRAAAPGGDPRLSTAPAPDPAAAPGGAPPPTLRPDAPPPDRQRPNPLADAGMALSFLTVVPTPAAAHTRGDFGRAAGWFPLVGAAVGALAGGVRAAAEPLLGPAPATVLALVALTAATGALHQDGLADCADGLGVRGDRARRLEVMRDSRIGTFGMLALLGWGLLLLTSLAPLTRADGLLALVAAGALGRAAALVHATTTPPARRDGLGAGFTVRRVPLALGLLTAVAIALPALGPARGALALGAAALLTAATSRWAGRALGGRTGDTLGATVALAELAVVVALAASWR